MSETYEEYLKRIGPAVDLVSMPGGYINGQGSTMTMPSSPDYKREQWANSLSQDDINKLIQVGVNNRLNLAPVEDPAKNLNPVFDPKNPIVSDKQTKTDNDGNSITTTLKGVYDDAVDVKDSIFETLGEAHSGAKNAIGDSYNAVNSAGTSAMDFLSKGVDAAKGGVEGYYNWKGGVNENINSFLDNASEHYSNIYNDSADNVSNAYDFVNKNWNEYGPGTGKASEVFDNLTESVAGAELDDVLMFGDKLIGKGYEKLTGVEFINKLINGPEIPAEDDGSEEKISAAYDQLQNAKLEAEKLLGVSYDVPSMAEIHPVDAAPAVMYAQKRLDDQLAAKEKIINEGGFSVKKITDSETVENIANFVQQKSFELGDDAGDFVKENPWLAVATLGYGGKAIHNVSIQSWQLMRRLAEKAPWLLKKLKWFVAPDGGLLFSLAAGEQIVKNKDDIDAFIEKHVPKAIHSPIETIANALGDSNTSDEVLVETIDEFLAESEKNQDVTTSVLDETATSLAGQPEVPKVDDPTDPTDPAVSVFNTGVDVDLGTISLDEVPAAESLVVNAGVENLSPTTDEAAIVLSETPELIQRMNSLADYMDSTTDEEGLAAARQAAIDIENDSSHSDRTSAAAMTFIASMLFGGNMTDSFNAAFTPIGKYYDAKRAAAVKRADEKAAKDIRIEEENRAAARSDEVYEKTLKDTRANQEKADQFALKKFNAEQRAINTRFNIKENNALLIAQAKANNLSLEAMIKATEKEQKRIRDGRDQYITNKIQGAPTDFVDALYKNGKQTIGEQAVTAISLIEKIIGRNKNPDGSPKQFDLTLPVNREAVDKAIHNYRTAVMSGTDFGRPLSTFVTDMIVKRELKNSGNGQIIHESWFEVPTKNLVLSQYMPSGADEDDYNYGKLNNRGKLGKTEKAFAESTNNAYDKIQDYAWSKDTASGNPMGTDAATQYFVKDFQDMQKYNDGKDFDRLVRMAVKEGLHPFTYFVLTYPTKAPLGTRYETK